MRSDTPSVPFEPDPYRDTTEEWEVELDLTCEHCGGSGADPWEGFMPCEECDGQGYRWWE